MRFRTFRYSVDLQHGISVFDDFLCGIAVRCTPQCPPPYIAFIKAETGVAEMGVEETKVKAAITQLLNTETKRVTE